MSELVDEVVAALDLVTDEAESAIADVKAGIRAATDDERLDDLDGLRRKLETMRTLVNEMADLRTRWIAMQGEKAADLDSEASTSGDARAGTRRYFGRVKRGTRTPEATFRQPILEALVELGGAGSVGDVLDLVEQKMTGQLKPVDREALPSNADTPRWRNTARWSRNELVGIGLLHPVRRWGVWEITEQGREWLAKRR